jgi:hypothetical protein
MEGIPTSAGSASRRENEFRAGGGTRRRLGRDPVWVGFVSVMDLRVGHRRGVKPRSAWGADWLTRRREDAKTRRGEGTKTGCHCLPVLASLRLERSGREESGRTGSCCPVCEEAGNLSPRWGWFSWGDGTQRSRAGLSSDGPPGLGPGFGQWVCLLGSMRWGALSIGDGHNRDAVGFRFGINPSNGVLVPRPPLLGWGSQRRWRWWGRSLAA